MELKDTGPQLDSWKRSWGRPSKAGPHCSRGPCSGQPDSMTAMLRGLWACVLHTRPSGVWGLSVCLSRPAFPHSALPGKDTRKRAVVRSTGFALRLPGSKPSPTGKGLQSLNHSPASSSVRWG